MNLKEANLELLPAFQEAVGEIFEAGWFIRGSFGTRFERAFADYCETPFCVGVGNGLDALVMALRALGIGHGDEVVVPANSFVATALAVSHVGARPVLVDPSPDTCNMIADNLAEVITGRTRAIIPVHLYGQACEMTPLMDLARRFDLHVIEDNAQAQGARSHGKRTGSFGVLNATSFYPGKNLGAAGDAGAVTGHDPGLMDRVRMLGNYGSAVKYHHKLAGQNSRLDELQAALLLLKLERLDEGNRERQRIAALYAEALAGEGDLILPVTAQGVEHVYHLFVVRTRNRDALLASLKEQGVEALIHYPIPIHLQACHQEMGYKPGAFPVSETIAGTCLSLPIFPGMTEGQVARVAGAVRYFFKTRSGSLAGTSSRE
jgi:dTDP-4-amino-4,6-dideoxygalactose transaminase